ncbi:polysaccharide deacetylase family protein [Paenibacillus phocaensis]|uniref:polysaccharide deacetylase family protein n=1 Tax=Paenibacillus phocaensis TaxID=1776378 RepID=UPI0003A89BD9|nr:polysaccharide deacetylase family protein [Paenibacillus phocaensis]
MGEKAGILVVSLDFELYWGVRDLYTKSEYGAKWLGEREWIPAILELFQEAGVHATWATVGLLFFADRREMLAGLPALKPGYADPRLSPYAEIEAGAVGDGEAEDPYLYAPTLIEQIRQTPGQAIGSHTFSHFYCTEKGQTVDEFYSDLQAAVAAAEKRGIPLQSLVLPRNQLRRQYMRRLPELGFKTYRGNPRHALYRGGYSASDPFLRRALRLADSYINLTGHHTYSVDSISPRLPIDLPASFFFRSPPEPLRRLERLRIKRIKNGMTQAARQGQVYHLWLHPYNAADEAAFRSLDNIIRHFRLLAEQYGMVSMNMEELGERILAGVGESEAEAEAEIAAESAADDAENRSLQALIE